MEDLNQSIQTSEQLWASPDVETMLVDPILESPSARWPVKESTATTDGLGGGEWLAPMVDEPVAVLGAMARAVGSSKADAGVADTAPESRVEKPVLPEASKGMVGHTVRPPRPLVVPPAMEEDKVEEIEHEEAQPQAIWILRKWGDKVVVVEEEDTTREVRRLVSTLSTAMKQIKVSIASTMSICVVRDRSSS